MKKIASFLIIFLIFSSCASWRSAKKSETVPGTYDMVGTALWTGSKTVIYPIPTTAYRGACGKRKGVSVIRLDKPRLWRSRIMDVVAWLEPIWDEMTPEDIAMMSEAKKARYRDPLVINETLCQFDPRIAVVPVGTIVQVKNEDRKDHWLVIQGKHKPREQFIQYYGKAPSALTLETPNIHHTPSWKPITFTAKRTDIWHLSSGMHRWMDAWVIITDKTWFAAANKKGIFEIKDVPRGVYRVHTWHPILGESSTIVRVPEDIGSPINIDYNKIPDDFRKVTSTAISTEKEIKQLLNIWDDDDDGL